MTAGNGIGRLSGPQRERLTEWLPGAEVLRDHSWGLVGTAVLEVADGGVRYVVKAGDDRDHHVAREERRCGRTRSGTRRSSSRGTA